MFYKVCMLEKVKVDETFKTSLSLLSNLFPKKFVAPMTVIRKFGDVISFDSAGYINAG